MHARPEAPDALLAAHDLARLPPMPAPLARLLQRHNEEAVERRFAAAALTLAEAAEMIAALADRLPAAALAPARAWALARLEQHGAVGIPPGLAARPAARPRRGRCGGTPAQARRSAGPRRGRHSAKRSGPPAWPGCRCCRSACTACPGTCRPAGVSAAAPQAMEAMNPFALAAHHLPVVLAALEEGWAGYAPAAGIHAVTTPSGRRLLRREDGGAVWNHHPARIGRRTASPRSASTSRSWPAASSAPAPRRACRCGSSSW